VAIAIGGGVRIMKKDGTLLREVVGANESDVIARHLAWSPDGRWLAYLADRVTPVGRLTWPTFDLHVVEARTGAMSVLASDCHSLPVWSLDSRRVAVSAGRGFDPGKYDLRTFEAPSWKEHELKRTGTPCFWNADGTLVAYSGEQLVLVDPSSSADPKPIVAATSPATASDDRRQICFFGRGIGGYSLQLYDVASKTTSTLVKAVQSQYAYPEAPVISPDGGRVAYTRRENLIVADVATGKERAIGEGRLPVWLLDGRLAYEPGQKTGKGTTIVDLTTGSASAAPGMSPAWAPLPK
jgi:Tol biopolymer transport system component